MPNLSGTELVLQAVTGSYALFYLHQTLLGRTCKVCSVGRDRVSVTVFSEYVTQVTRSWAIRALAALLGANE